MGLAADPSSLSEREERWLGMFAWPTWSGGLYGFVAATLFMVGIGYAIWAVVAAPSTVITDVSQRMAGGLLAGWLAYMAWTWGFLVRPRRIQDPLLAAWFFVAVCLAFVASWIDQAVRGIAAGGPGLAVMDGLLAGCVLYLVVRVVTLVIVPSWRR